MKKINSPIIPFFKGDEHKNKAFTLVELIVVITILAILATIGFVSFSGYLAGTRDTNRIAQIKSMSDALELYRTKKDLPIPDDKIDVKSSGSVIAYQGYIGKNVLETIEYTESGLDPKDKNYFSYYLTKNKKYFQLLAFLEEENKDVVAMKPHPNPLLKGEGIIGKSFATDYSERYPKTTGKKLGILTDANNTPVQEVSAITGSGFIDLYNVGTEEYKAIISDTEIISGTGTALASTNPKATCKRIKQIKGGSSDGVYTIDPEANGTGFKVYCDMTTDGGGWMLATSISKGIAPDYSGIKNAYLNNETYNNNGIYILNKIVKTNIYKFKNFIVDYQYGGVGDYKINENYFIKNKIGNKNIGFSLVAKTNGDTYNDLGSSEQVIGIDGYTLINYNIPDNITFKCNSNFSDINNANIYYGFRKGTNTFFGYYACSDIAGVFAARLNGGKIILFAKDDDTDYNAKKIRFWVR